MVWGDCKSRNRLLTLQLSRNRAATCHGAGRVLARTKAAFSFTEKPSKTLTTVTCGFVSFCNIDLSGELRKDRKVDVTVHIWDGPYLLPAGDGLDSQGPRLT